MTSSASHVAAMLHARYFAGVDGDDAGMSSHWRMFTARASVRVGADGIPVDARGEGFGDMNVRRRGNALLTPLAAVLHSLHHPARGRVLSAWRTVRSITRRAGLVMNQDALRQALTLAFLEPHLREHAPRRIVLIGDGYGVLGAALAARYPSAEVVFVDLGRSLLFQSLTCGRVFPDAGHLLLGADERTDGSRFVYCPADRLDLWPAGPIDLAVNVASMQEMAPETVAGYFDLLRRAPTAWFYCCNRVSKTMPGGEVSEFAAYPWSPADVHVVDGPCPWHQWYLRPRRRGVRVSLVSRYDGPHVHRLTRLASRTH